MPSKGGLPLFSSNPFEIALQGDMNAPRRVEYSCEVAVFLVDNASRIKLTQLLQTRINREESCRTQSDKKSDEESCRTQAFGPGPERYQEPLVA